MMRKRARGWVCGDHLQKLASLIFMYRTTCMGWRFWGHWHGQCMQHGYLPWHCVDWRYGQMHIYNGTAANITITWLISTTAHTFRRRSCDIPPQSPLNPLILHTLTCFCHNSWTTSSSYPICYDQNPLIYLPYTIWVDVCSWLLWDEPTGETGLDDQNGTKKLIDRLLERSKSCWGPVIIALTWTVGATPLLFIV